MLLLQRAAQDVCVCLLVRVQIAARERGKKIKKSALTSYFSRTPPPPPPPRPSTFIQLKFQLYYTSWPLLYFMGHWGISKHFSPVHNVLGTGLLLLLRAPPPLLVMMLYCINIARAAHTESQGRLDFEGWHSALQGRGCRRFSDCAALRGAEHITLVNALPSGSECGSVYAIKITFNCAFGIVDGCSAPPAQRRGLQQRRPPACHCCITSQNATRSECWCSVDCTVCNE